MKRHQATIVLLLAALGAPIALGQAASADYTLTPCGALTGFCTRQSHSAAHVGGAGAHRHPRESDSRPSRRRGRCGPWQLAAGRIAAEPQRSAIGEQQMGSHGRAEQDYVAFSQEFVGIGKLRLSREVAAKEVARAEQELAMQRSRVLTDVRIAFYTAIVAQRQRPWPRSWSASPGWLASGGKGEPATIRSFRTISSKRGSSCDTAEIEARKSLNRHVSAWRSLAAVIGQPELPLDRADRRRGDGGPRARLARDRPAAAVAESRRSPPPCFRSSERGRPGGGRRIEPDPNVTVDALVNWRDNGIDGDPDGGLQVSFRCRSGIGTKAPWARRRPRSAWPSAIWSAWS